MMRRFYERDDLPWKRILVVFALFILSIITYIDRAAISTAKDSIESDLYLSERSMGFVFSAFAIGYAIGQVPAGWLADRIGPRRTLALTVALWSALTALTGFVWSAASLLTVRFFFGIGEAAVFPGSARAIRSWLPSVERGRANGALFAGSRLGAALSYPLMVLILQHWNWRRGFLVLGLIGIVWAATWLLWFRDRSTILTSERTEIVTSGGPHLQIENADATPRVIVGLMFQYVVSNFTNFICLSWMFSYLQSTYGLSPVGAALYSMPPLLCGATALAETGCVVDRMYRSQFAAWSRRTPAIAGFLLSACGIYAVTGVHNVYAAVICFTVAIFGADATVGPSWVVCADIGGTKTGRLSGTMNLLGSLGAFASANAFPIMHEMTGSSSAYFVLAAVLDVIAVVCWLGMSSVTVVNRQQQHHQAGV